MQKNAWDSFIHLRINCGPICDANCYIMCTLGSHSSPVSTSFMGFYLGSWNEDDFFFGQYSIVWIVWVQLVSSGQRPLDLLVYGHVSSLGHVFALQCVQWHWPLDTSSTQIVFFFFLFCSVFVLKRNCQQIVY